MGRFETHERVVVTNCGKPPDPAPVVAQWPVPALNQIGSPCRRLMNRKEMTKLFEATHSRQTAPSSRTCKVAFVIWRENNVHGGWGAGTQGDSREDFLMDDPCEIHEKIKKLRPDGEQKPQCLMVTLLATCRALVNSYLRLALRSEASVFSLLANGCSEIKYNPKLLKMTPAGGAVSLSMYRLFCTRAGSLISCKDFAVLRSPTKMKTFRKAASATKTSHK